jgi:transcriptional regulator with XRE-family HTH domain
MKGQNLKELLRRENVSLVQLAEALGMSQQNLSAAFTRDDVKSGFLEKVAKAIGCPVGFFYDEVAGSPKIVGNNNTQISGDSNTVAPSDAALLELLKANSDQLTMAMKQTSKAQEQMDRVLDRLEGRSLEMPENF